jgi:isoleucyl-tRNA synthetase
VPDQSSPLFKPVPAKVNFAGLEREVLAFWKEADIFAKSLELRRNGEKFVFFEGPPTANGAPGTHHVLARAFKDAVPRYQSMRGRHVRRKGGWDTHGLPVELEVEKRLGFTRKQDIEKFGVAEFNRLCRESVFEYVGEWVKMTDRIAYWVDMEDAYWTLHDSYIESCWWVLKTLWDRGLVYQDYRVSMHCPRCNTGLSDHEVSQGFRDDVDDPSVWIEFPLTLDSARNLGCDGGVFALAWTTTPWTLPGNVALAVNPVETYVVASAGGKHYLLAEKRLATALGEQAVVVARFSGTDIARLVTGYEPVFEGRAPAGSGGRLRVVVADESATVDDGSGIVHIAPAYGDLEVGRRHGLATLLSVDLSGNLYPEVREPGGPAVATGEFFKQADAALTRSLQARGLLLRGERVRHAYPFCWRCETPLLYYAKDSWYLKTTAFKDKLVELNATINWIPAHFRDGRFGEWLRNNIDWAVSRERFWGTPLPVWRCQKCARTVCVGSVRELSELAGRDLTGLDLHRPHVDEITFPCECPGGGGVYRRAPEVLDAWFDSGAMPYAQDHFPFDHPGSDRPEQFPADYICEAVDQTRGWFYTLHALATMLFDSVAFENVICLGHMVDENGRKMSKSRGNVLDPIALLDEFGADALRWNLYSYGDPGGTRRFGRRLLTETVRGFMLTLWNTYAFFVLYANLDTPELRARTPAAKRGAMDRWALARLTDVVARVTNALDAFDLLTASRVLEAYLDELSNWYVRRNRRRFWDGDAAAYQTLWECLVTVSRLLAPFTPFVAEELHQNLVRRLDPGAPESVHLADWPVVEPALADEALVRDMDAAIRLVELGRSARAQARLKVRQPLAEAVIQAPPGRAEGAERFLDQVADELNVKSVRWLDAGMDLVSYRVRPNLPVLGRRLGKQLPAVRAALEAADPNRVAAAVREGQPITVETPGGPVELAPAEILVDALAPEGLAVGERDGFLVALDTRLTPELVSEGLARDLIRAVQQARKEAGLHVSDRIALWIDGGDGLAAQVGRFQADIAAETLAVEVTWSAPPPDSFVAESTAGDVAVRIGVRRSPVPKS